MEMGAAVERLYYPRLESILDLIPSGVIVLNAKGDIAHSNPAAEEIIAMPVQGRAWCDVILEAFSPRHDDGYEVSLKNGKRVSILIRSLHPDPGQLILITDLTETRELQQRLSRQERLATMGKIAAKLAHQIRTPLATAVLYAGQLGQPERLTEEKQRKFFQKLQTSLHQIEGQVRDMLSFTRGGNASLQTTTIAEILQVLQDTAFSERVKHQITFICQDYTNNARVTCYRDALIGALQNLIQNAFEASPPDSIVNVVVQYGPSNTLEFIVEDKGCGMTKEVIEKIKQGFYTTRPTGTGLGFAVVQAVTAAHGGGVVVVSEPDIGTRVVISLPLQEIRAHD
jgi:two-component system sensor histidine kinase FlrB